MATRDIIVVGTSMGGVEALKELASGLPADLPAAILAVIHISPDYRSLLPEILSRAGRLPAVHAQHGRPIERGRMYLAPPDHHLLVESGAMRVIRGPRENGFRPAVDPLFRTAAYHYGPRVIGVVLTGARDCGTAGLKTIKARGGLAVVQDPADALCASMPMSAMEHVQVDYQAPLRELPALLDRLARQSNGQDAPPPSKELEQEVKVLQLDPAIMLSDDRSGTPSAFSCPDCGGVLWELDDGDLLRFRCRTGHGYSAEALQEAQLEDLDQALYAALKALEEKASLSRKMAVRARQARRAQSAEIFERRAQEAEQQVLLLRQAILGPTEPGKK